MEETTNGWVVISINHPNSKKKIMMPQSFALTRAESIKQFISDSGSPWKYWYRKYNYRCVKAISTISTVQ